MKRLAGILIIVSVVLGTIGAATAYTPLVQTLYSFEPEILPTLARPVEMSVDRLEDLPTAERPTLGGPVYAAGDEEPLAVPTITGPPDYLQARPLSDADLRRFRAAGVDRVPILVPPADGRRITEEEIIMLRDLGVERIVAKNFRFEHWSGRWWFMLGCLGLLIGGLILRLESAETTAPGPGVRAPGGEAALRDALERVRTLIAARDTPSDTPRVAQILATIDQVHADCLDPFVAGRTKIINTAGMAGYAQIMDVFSGAERQLNRAWSAAADEQLDESELCLEEGAERLEQTLKKMSAVR